MTSKRSVSFDIVRIAATVFILLHHYQQDTGAHFSIGINFYDGNFYWGYMVELFFILSGFFAFKLVKKIMKGYSFREYFSKKYIRLIPAVFVAAFTYEMLVFMYCHQSDRLYEWSTPSRIDVWGTIISALGFQEGWGFTNPAINNPTWYISVLLLCYVWLYVIAFFAKKLGINPIYGYILMIMIGTGITTYSSEIPFFCGQDARGYYAFFTGVLLGNVCESHKEVSNRCRRICELIFALEVLCLIFRINYVYADGVRGNTPFFLTFCVYPLLVIICHSLDLHNRFIGIIGEITYDIYVWHNVVLFAEFVILNHYRVNVDFSSARNVMLYILAVVIVGTVSHFTIDRFVPRIFDSKRECGN